MRESAVWTSHRSSFQPLDARTEMVGQAKLYLKLEEHKVQFDSLTLDYCHKAGRGWSRMRVLDLKQEATGRFSQSGIPV